MIQPGQTASYTIKYVDKDGTPINLEDLESYEVHLFDSHGTRILMFANTEIAGYDGETEETNAADGECELVLQAEQTAKMKNEVYIKMITKQEIAGQGYEDDIYVDITQPVLLDTVQPPEKMKSND